MSNQSITPPSKKSLLEGEIKFIAEQLKKQGKTLADALAKVRKQNEKFAEELSESLSEQEWRETVQGVYGTAPRKLFLSTSVMSQIIKKVITWTVEGVLLAGVLNLFVGDPDIGKSLIAVWYIAHLTREGKKVIIICREDDYGYVWVPRLLAAGADLTLIIPVHHVGDENDPDYEEAWMLDNHQHLSFLKACIVNHNAALCLIDPLADFAGSKNLNKTGDVRTLTGPLNRIAQETGVCLLVNCHTTKTIADSVIKAAAGNFQIMAAVAVAWFFMEDPDKPDRNLMLCARNKFGGKKTGRRYTIADASETDDTGLVRFVGSEYRNVNGLLKQLQGRDKDSNKTADCRKWLMGLLDGGPQPTELCNKAAQAFGFDKDTVNRACTQLKVLRDGKTWRIEPKEAEQQPTFDGDTQNRGDQWNC